jgi:selenocysteine lyase/cysteine desulfurase
LQEVLSKDTDKKIKAVCVVHNETTTGVTSDIKGLRAAMDAANHPALLLVDGVSSIGALEFKFDDWGVDVAVTGSQKALSLPTGLALVCASDKVRLWVGVGAGLAVRLLGLMVEVWKWQVLGLECAVAACMLAAGLRIR